MVSIETVCVVAHVRRCEQEASDALDGKRAYDTEFRVVHPNGVIRHLKATARITHDADGHLIQMFGVNLDITERKRGDEQFRLAIEAAPTGMLLMNRTGAMVLVNAQIEKLFGYPRAELLGKQIEMLVPERFRTHHPDFREGFFGTPRARAMGAGRELYGLRKDGSEVPIEIGLNPLHTPEGAFVLSSIVDLSQRHEIDRIRTDFVSTVSHELRTPLTSITGSLGLLQSGALGALPDKAAAMVQIAYKNSGRLVRLINYILDVGKLEAEVEDSGPGIPEALKGRIFEKFAQADTSTTGRFEGSGLGLSIARKLTEAMGGTIGFSTVAGQGTIFHLDLPRISAASTAPM